MTTSDPTSRPSKLALKVGGNAAALMTREIAERAHAHLLERAPTAIADIASRLHGMHDLASALTPQTAHLIFQHAHDIRGIAGTFGRPSIGDVADALCAYLDDLAPHAAPNAELVLMLVNAMRAVLIATEGAAAAEIVAVSRVAVRTIRTREGRGAELD